MRKPSSQAYPLTSNSNKARVSREALYDFENRLREVISELTDPIYKKIEDTLTQLRSVKSSQDDVSRQTKELEFEISECTAYGTKMDDLKVRVDENQERLD